MNAASLAELLPDFARQGGQSEREETRPHVDEELADGVPQPGAGPSLDERVAAAEEALRATLTSEHEARLAAAQERHAQELAALQAELGEKAGTAIATGFADMESRVVELATSVTARILSVALSDDLQRRAVEALARAVREAIGERDAVRVHVSGAPPLFEALEKAVGDKAGYLDFSESTTFDLTVSIDESVFETRLSEWSEALAEVLS